MSTTSNATPCPWLSVPHYKQESRATCLPACVRMVLAYYGEERTEAELSQWLNVRFIGAQTENLRRLRQHGYEVYLEQSSWGELSDWLLEDVPPIAFVNAAELPGWFVPYALHAVVVVGVTAEEVIFHDPQFAESPRRATWACFREAWVETEFSLGAIVRLH